MINEFSNARIGIIGAMQVEVDLLKQTMEEQGSVNIETVSGRDFYEGSIYAVSYTHLTLPTTFVV